MRWLTETMGIEKSARLEVAARSRTTGKLDLAAVRLWLEQQIGRETP
jgi:hypothetical protein